MIAKRVVRVMATNKQTGERKILRVEARKDKAGLMLVKFGDKTVGAYSNEDAVTATAYISSNYTDLSPCSYAEEFVFPITQASSRSIVDMALGQNKKQ